MEWKDINKDYKNNNDDGINWIQRYKYVINQMDELGYILSKCKPKKVGKLYVAKCPFPHHNEKTGSFTIYPKDHLIKGIPQGKVTFYCFGCGEGGDIIRFHQLYYSCNTRHEACKALEKELGINIEDEDIQRELLKEGLNSLLNTERQQLDYNSVNLICSKMCREYLNYVRDNYKHLLRNEFEAIQNYFKQFDEEILEMVGDETEYLIFQTEEMIKNRKEKLKI